MGSSGYEITAPAVDPESSDAAKACAYKNWMFDNINKWTEAHLTSCRSYRRNNRFAKRLEKWDEIYNRVFDCETATTTTTTTAEPPTTTTTAEPGPDCGCYAPDEEIPIENDKCVLDLSSVSDVTGDWSFAFELKINSLPTEPSDPPYNSGIDWYVWIVTGNHYASKASFNLLLPEKFPKKF